jgi:hypothetical protein
MLKICEIPESMFTFAQFKLDIIYQRKWQVGALGCSEGFKY